MGEVEGACDLLPIAHSCDTFAHRKLIELMNISRSDPKSPLYLLHGSPAPPGGDASGLVLAPRLPGQRATSAMKVA